MVSRTSLLVFFAFWVVAIPKSLFAAEEVLFEDQFKKGLSDQWKIVGLEKEDYRIKNGGLEIRVAPGPQNRATPRVNIILPFNAASSVVASVKITLLDEFTEENEFAGLFLIDEQSAEFAAKKERIGDRVVFAPGHYEFQGKKGEEGDPKKYKVQYSPATKNAGAIRIIVNQGYAYFQVGPSKEDKYQTFFHSAIRKKTKERGFALMAGGAPKEKAHWVRFEDFKVIMD
jgi:hypothetical protein